jgi:hypothetical protein
MVASESLGVGDNKEASFYPGSPVWTTGSVQVDNAFGKLTIDHNILLQLGQLSVQERSTMITGTLKKNPSHPNAWLNKCLSNSTRGSAGSANGVSQAQQPRRVASPMMHGPPIKVCRLEQNPLPQAKQETPQASAVLPIVAVVHPVTPPDVEEGIPIFYKIPIGPGASVCMPEWVREGLLCIDDPQALLSQVCTRFDEQVGQSFFQHTPRLQVMMIVSLLFNAHMWTDVNAGMSQLLMLHDGALGNPEVAIVGLEEVKCVLQLIVIHNCSGVGTGFLVFHTALKMFATQFPGTEFKVVEEHSFEIDPVAMKVQQRVAELMSITVEFHPDVNELPDLISKNKQAWAGKKLLMLNSFPCKNTSTASNFRDRESGSGFHMQHSRAVWPIIEAISEALPEFGKGCSFHLTEYPPCGNEGEESLMNKHFGQSVGVTTAYYRSAKRDRNIRTEPFNLELKYCSVPTDPSGSMDGWTWCGNRDHRGQLMHGTYPEVVLRSYIVKLTQDAMFKLESLGEGELKTLNSIKMMHAVTKDERFISRDFWYQWLGMLNTCIAKALDELFPCMVWIIKSAGVRSHFQGVGEACGTSRWCRNCEQVFLHLGQAWHVPIMVDIAFALLKKISDVNRNNDVMNSSCRNVVKEVVHKCGPGCVHNPAPGV